MERKTDKERKKTHIDLKFPNNLIEHLYHVDNCY